MTEFDESPTPAHRTERPPPPTVTVVDGWRGGERVVVPIDRFDEHFVYVNLAGDEKRFSRETGFEIPEGGSWSRWRLCGKDHRAWRP